MPATPRRSTQQKAALAARFCKHAHDLFSEAAQQETPDPAILRQIWQQALEAFPEARTDALLWDLRKALLNLREERRTSEAKPADGIPVVPVTALKDSDVVEATSDVALISSTEMQKRTHQNRQALASAVANRRLFQVTGPHGRKYYPAFFTDERYQRAHLAAVTQALGALSGQEKLDFLSCRLTCWDKERPYRRSPMETCRPCCASWRGAQEVTAESALS
jgi:hypothetical protein